MSGIDFTKPKLRNPCSHIPSKGSGHNRFHCLFLHSLVCGPFLYLQILEQNIFNLSASFYFRPPFPSFNSLAFLLQIPLYLHRAHPYTAEYSPMSRLVIHSYLQSLFAILQLTQSQHSNHRCLWVSLWYPPQQR